MSLMRFFKKSSSSSMPSKNTSTMHSSEQGNHSQSFPKEWSSHNGPFLNRSHTSFDQAQGRGGASHEYPSMGHHYPQERHASFSDSSYAPQGPRYAHQPHLSVPPHMQHGVASRYGGEVPLSLDSSHGPQQYGDPRYPYAKGPSEGGYAPYPSSHGQNGQPHNTQSQSGPIYGAQQQGYSQTYNPSHSFQGPPPSLSQWREPRPEGGMREPMMPFSSRDTGNEYPQPPVSHVLQEDHGHQGGASRFASHPTEESFFQMEQDRLRGRMSLNAGNAGDFQDRHASKPYVPKKPWFFGRKTTETPHTYDHSVQEEGSFLPEPANASSGNPMDLKDLRFWDSHPHDDAMEGAEHDQQEQKPLRFVFAVGILILFATVSWLLFRWSTQSVTSTVPHIQADPNPFKVRPDNPGGLVIPHQDKLVYGRLGHDAHQGAPVEHVLPPPEQPIQGGYYQSDPHAVMPQHHQGYTPEQGPYPVQQGYVQPPMRTPMQGVPQEYSYQQGQAQSGYAPPPQGGYENPPQGMQPMQGYAPYREDIQYRSSPQGYEHSQNGYVNPQGALVQPSQGYVPHQQQHYIQQAPHAQAYYPDNYPPQNIPHPPQNFEGQQDSLQTASKEESPSLITQMPAPLLSVASEAAPLSQPFSAPVFFKVKLGEFKTKQEASHKWQALKKDQKDMFRHLNYAIVKEAGMHGKSSLVLYALGLQGEDEAKNFCNKISGAKYYKQ